MRKVSLWARRHPWLFFLGLTAGLIIILQTARIGLPV